MSSYNTIDTYYSAKIAANEFIFFMLLFISLFISLGGSVYYIQEYNTTNKKIVIICILYLIFTIIGILLRIYYIILRNRLKNPTNQNGIIEYNNQVKKIKKINTISNIFCTPGYIVSIVMAIYLFILFSNTR